MPRTVASLCTLSAAAFRIYERSQVVETIGGDEPGSNQLPERRLDLRLQLAGAADNISKERSSTRAQVGKHFTGPRAQSAAQLFAGGAQWQHPISIFARKKCDGRNTGWNHAAAAIAGILKRGRMR